MWRESVPVVLLHFYTWGWKGCHWQMALELYVLTKRTMHMYQLFIVQDEECLAGALLHKALVQILHAFWICHAGAPRRLLVQFSRVASFFDHRHFAPCVQAPAAPPPANTQSQVSLQHGNHHDRVSFLVSNRGGKLVYLTFLIPLTHLRCKIVVQSFGLGMKGAQHGKLWFCCLVVPYLNIH